MQLNDRQTAITLASLRYVQERVRTSPMFAAMYVDDNPIVTAEEIDSICETLNFGDTEDAE
jgi:hypothetical protein